jgi:hypothetical protein
MPSQPVDELPLAERARPKLIGRISVHLLPRDALSDYCAAGS